jgi:hypothetical protein
MRTSPFTQAWSVRVHQARRQRRGDVVLVPDGLGPVDLPSDDNPPEDRMGDLDRSAGRHPFGWPPPVRLAATRSAGRYPFVWAAAWRISRRA